MNKIACRQCGNFFQPVTIKHSVCSDECRYQRKLKSRRKYKALGDMTPQSSYSRDKRCEDCPRYGFCLDKAEKIKGQYLLPCEIDGDWSRRYSLDERKQVQALMAHTLIFGVICR